MLRRSLVPVLMLAFLASPGAARAVTGGVASNTFGSLGCNLCHAGGPVPTVSLVGPTSADPGETLEYLLTISTPQPAGGLNVTATAGLLSVGGSQAANTQAILGANGQMEITHDAPKAADSGSVTFSFLWTAPAAFSSVELLGWGNAVNLDVDLGGDFSVSDRLTIAGSGGPVPTPSAGDPPVVFDPELEVELVADGLDEPTSMAFLAEDDILILEKVSGRVMRVRDGELLPDPVLDLAVNGSGLRGLLGIAINTEDPPAVFLFATETTAPIDGAIPSGHNVLRYRWDPLLGILTDREVLFTFPRSPVFSPTHKGGVVIVGPPNPGPGAVGDGGLVYAVMGDNGTSEGPTQFDRQLANQPAGVPPDDYGVIIRLQQDGSPAPGNPFVPYCSVTTTQQCPTGTGCPSGETCLTQVESYFAYGIRNSFGLDLDPVTGVLWETENGPFRFDEINVAEAGWNNGWEEIWGTDSAHGGSPDDMWNMPGGASAYSDPEFTWDQPVGVTTIVFPVGSQLGAFYDDFALVGDSRPGQIYAFPLNASRDGFDLSGFPELGDLFAEDQDAADLLVWAAGFGVVADIEIAPDGTPHVVSLPDGAIYRIEPRPCPLTPGTCRTPTLPGSATVVVRDRPNDSADQYRWSWARGAATTKAEFGDPSTDGFALCSYANGSLVAEAEVPPGGACGNASCWRENSKGYRYRDSTSSAEGIRSLRLRAGEDGRARIEVRLRGIRAELPDLADLPSPLVVQLHNLVNGECWGSTFSFPPALRHTDTTFKDRSD